jgi:GMP synthase (glutamine-hydrolysing)
VRALFICHETDDDSGYLGEAARRRGLDVATCALWDGAPLPDPSGFDLVVPLGSAEAAYDDDVPWLAAELDHLDRAVAAGVAVFGVCFGAQALARVLGGEVRPSTRPEVGWITVDSDDPDLIAPGPWFEWHFDTLTPPPGATTLARTPAAVQGFALQRTVGVQFHPEVTPAIIASWTASSGDKVRRVGVDPAALVAESRERAHLARRRAHDLFDRVLARLDVTPG